jgi:DNA modification methylase
MIIEKKKIADLIPAPYNPRQSTAKQEKHLKESLQKFGLVEPIIFNKQTGYIVGGHFRVRELKKLGINEIECVIVDLNEDDEKELNIRLNANTGGWDWDTLANDWDVVDLEAWGLDIPQFDNVPEELEASEDDYEVPEGGIETDIVIGDLFEIGEHRLLCGDSTDSDAVARLMNGENPTLILSDPPYGIGISGQKKSIAKNPKHNRKFHEDKEWDKEVPDLNVLLSYNCDIILWGGNYFIDYITSNKGWICWSKGQDGQLTMSDGELAWTNINKPLRIVTVNRANLGKTVHPTQKPIEVMIFSINYSESIGTISDFFLGSGSTMVAAHQLKRRCFGMELEPKYCQVIIDRMRKLDSSLIIKRNGMELKQA